MQEKNLTFLEHFQELRARALKSIAACLVASVLVYNFVPRLMPAFTKPAGKLVFTAPAEAFLAYLTIALWGGILLSSPVTIYQLWRFAACGLHEHERKPIFILALVSLACFIVGCSIGYFVMVPFALRFFLSYATPYVQPMITVSNYVSLVVTFSLTFGLVFQLPLVALFLNKCGVIRPEHMSRFRREAIVGILILAAFVTPGPDVISQVIVAMPMYILYELSIVLMRFIR